MKRVNSGFLFQRAVSGWILSVGVGIVTVVLSGCGSVGGSQTTSPPPTPPPSPQAVVISTQPLSQTVPIGRTATFSVVASGTGPLQYQWSENGAPIAGATSASYTTPVVALSDSGSTFQVTVSNATSSATSENATLMVGPRAPALGDLRYLLFEQVTAAGFFQNGVHTNILVPSTFWMNNALGTPLGIGSSYVCGPGIAYDCAWVFTAYALPPGQTGLSMYYTSDVYSSFSSDMQSIVAPNVVIDSLDMEPSNEAYAISFVKTAQKGGFDYRLEVVSPDQLQATVANDGAESRVVTAVSFDANNEANVISYGWTGDTTTVYEAQTVIAQPGEVASQAETLAANGYFISAFGGNDTDGYMLIGMRVEGDTMARPISVYSSSGSIINTIPPQSPPYASTILDAGFNGIGEVVAAEE